jgi:hypothetical protein
LERERERGRERERECVCARITGVAMRERRMGETSDYKHIEAGNQERVRER